jgi:hypothetical protein
MDIGRTYWVSEFIIWKKQHIYVLLLTGIVPEAELPVSLQPKNNTLLKKMLGKLSNSNFSIVIHL